jgi:hypothetical protein
LVSFAVGGKIVRLGLAGASPRHDRLELPVNATPSGMIDL